MTPTESLEAVLALVAAMDATVAAHNALNKDDDRYDETFARADNAVEAVNAAAINFLRTHGPAMLDEGRDGDLVPLLTRIQTHLAVGCQARPGYFKAHDLLAIQINTALSAIGQVGS